MNYVVLLIALVGSLTVAHAETMYCDAFVYKGQDIDAALAEEPVSKDVFQKISVDVTPTGEKMKTGFSTETKINGLNVVLDFFQLGISDSYQVTFYVGKSLWDREGIIAASMYPESFQDGKPGTRPGEWPFPGENRGYIYEYMNFEGGPASLSHKVIEALKTAKLWNGRYSSGQFRLDNPEIIRFFKKDYKTLKMKNLINPSDLIYMQLGQCNKL